ncbi:MAG: TIGR02450 family Trp-rich protein [Planctomycetes bacterium]|nr:TIGR02450 family Trp-rich protein [Planctomycetota bacterium]
MTHPQDARHLVGSKWSARRPSERELHWIVVEFAVRKGLATLEAVLTKRRRELPWRELRDRTRWVPGWESPSEPAAGGVESA